MAASATSYVYDAFGDLTDVTDPASHVTHNTYDIRGRKLTAADPDMGGWSYVYDGYDELYSQTDAKSQVATLTYDALGRVLTRAETGLTSTWVYDTASGAGIGQLASAATGGGYSRVLAYDALGRPSTTTLTAGGIANMYATTYDADGRIATVGYPSGFTAAYTYTATLGYLSQVADTGGAHTVFWTAGSRDAELHLLTQTAGNGIVTTASFNDKTGLPTAILAGTSNSVSNQTFAFDSHGNLATRSWLNNAGASVSEAACYDGLNRLTGYKLTTSTSCPQSGGTTIAYDALGNITAKSDVCATTNCMAYGSSAGPHALTAVTGTYLGLTNPVLTYDANGNLTCVSTGSACSGTVAETATYTAFNMAATITQGSNTETLTYDSEHARIAQVATGANAGTTIYLNDPSSGAMEETFNNGSNLTARDYIMADGHMVAQRSVVVSTAPVWAAATWNSFTWTARSTPTLLYFTLDHLGSIAVITDASGTVVERDSYDPWGKRRNPDGTAASCGAITSATTRGFTAHEMIDAVCLINANARIYDPTVGRFMTADSVIPDPYDGQSFNRYSYVNNNPLSFTDPTGHGCGESMGGGPCYSDGYSELLDFMEWDNAKPIGMTLLAGGHIQGIAAIDSSGGASAYIMGAAPADLVTEMDARTWASTATWASDVGQHAQVIFLRPVYGKLCRIKL